MGEKALSELNYWVWLSQCFSPGSDKPNQLLADFDSPEEFYTRGLSELDGIEYLTDVERSKIQRTSLERADFILSECKRLGIQVLTLESASYPKHLKSIFSAPLVLYVKGSLEGLDEVPLITVVGTREASDYGKRLTGNICFELARAGMVVVSGCAVGIDSYAHLGALKGAGRTISVLGCGLDVNYPSAHRELKEQIVKKGGALVSELPPGTEVTPSIFPIRNRIMAGMSLGTLVTEAPERSGSLITAQHALEQGRDIFCVPPADLYSTAYSGVIRYLRDGATPVFCAKDVVLEYLSAYPQTIDVSKLLDSYTGMSGQSSASKAGKKAPEKRTVQTAPQKKEQAPAAPQEEEDISKKPATPASLDEKEKRVYTCLEFKPKVADEIAALSGMEMKDVLAVLTALEVKGYVFSCSGSRYGLLNK